MIYYFFNFTQNWLWFHSILLRIFCFIASLISHVTVRKWYHFSVIYWHFGHRYGCPTWYQQLRKNYYLNLFSRSTKYKHDSHSESSSSQMCGVVKIPPSKQATTNMNSHDHDDGTIQWDWKYWHKLHVRKFRTNVSKYSQNGTRLRKQLALLFGFKSIEAYSPKYETYSTECSSTNSSNNCIHITGKTSNTTSSQIKTYRLLFTQRNADMWTVMV